MLYEKNQIQQATHFYDNNGFCAISNIFEEKYLNKIKYFLENNPNISMDQSTSSETNDLVYLDPIFMELAFSSQVIEIAKQFLKNNEIELQHSKANIKYAKNEGRVDPHQDWPFFPHSNFDLIAVGVHLDGSSRKNGGVQYYPKTHFEVLDHFSDSEFKYRCSVPKNSSPTMLECPPGSISVHHCLTLHKSEALKTNINRRLLIFQYRSIFNRQVGGVIWKCTGLRAPGTTKKSFLTINNKNLQVRPIFDKYGRLKPNS